MGLISRVSSRTYRNKKLGKLPKKTMCSVFVGNIAWDVSEQELGDWFSQCGTVNSSYIKTDRQSGQTLGFGFVEFNDPNIADDVIKRMDGSFLGGRNIRCNRSNRTSLSHDN